MKAKHNGRASLAEQAALRQARAEAGLVSDPRAEERRRAVCTWRHPKLWDVLWNSAPLARRVLVLDGRELEELEQLRVPAPRAWWWQRLRWWLSFRRALRAAPGAVIPGESWGGWYAIREELRRR